MIHHLRNCPPLSIEIASAYGDQEAFGLAEQIKNIFTYTNWKVYEVSPAEINKPINHIMIQFGEKPSLEKRMIGN